MNFLINSVRIFLRPLAATLIGILTLCAVTSTSHAHSESNSYLNLTIEGSQVKGQWDISLLDIVSALNLKTTNSEQVPIAELNARINDIRNWSLASLKITRGGDCKIEVLQYAINNLSDGNYASLKLNGNCPAKEGEVKLKYKLLFDFDPDHNGLLSLNVDGKLQNVALTKVNSEFSFNSEVNLLKQGLDFLWQGIWHIWIGYDHILFLIALLLPVVLVRTVSGWQPATGFVQVLKKVFFIVTSFTIAHSITLSLASLGIVKLEARLVESVIGLSVLVAATLNIWPILGNRSWALAFVFGLIHGFGFANVLVDLGLPQEALTLSLVSFNFGVEIGQLAIVAVFLPIIFLLRKQKFYQKGIMVGGSAIVMAIGAYWFITRAFGL